MIHCDHRWTEDYERDTDGEPNLDKPVWICTECKLTTPIPDSAECGVCGYLMDPEGMCHSCDELVLAVDHGHAEGDP